MKLFFVIGTLLLASAAFAEDAATLVECKDQVGDAVRFTVVSKAPFEVGNVEVTSSLIYPPQGWVKNPRTGRVYSTNGSNSSGVNQGVTLSQVKNYYQLAANDKYGAFQYDLIFESTLVDPNLEGFGQFMYKWAENTDWLQTRRMKCTSSEDF